VGIGGYGRLGGRGMFLISRDTAVVLFTKCWFTDMRLRGRRTSRL